MSKAKGGVLASIGKALSSMGIRPPWRVSCAATALTCWSACRIPHSPAMMPFLQYTGPLSSPEYLSHLPAATDYRKTLPG